MEKITKLLRLALIGLIVIYSIFPNVVSAANKVVVIPMGGTVGNASAADVVKGKTFSSSLAGKGATGTLEYTEFCEGKDAGGEAFKLDIAEFAQLVVGDIYITNTGKLVEVVGINHPFCPEFTWVYYHKDISFLIAPTYLPEPCLGVKGAFYHLYDGKIVFAKFL